MSLLPPKISRIFSPSFRLPLQYFICIGIGFKPNDSSYHEVKEFLISRGFFEFGVYMFFFYPLYCVATIRVYRHIKSFFLTVTKCVDDRKKLYYIVCSVLKRSYVKDFFFRFKVNSTIFNHSRCSIPGAVNTDTFIDRESKSLFFCGSQRCFENNIFPDVVWRRIFVCLLSRFFCRKWFILSIFYSIYLFFTVIPSFKYSSFFSFPNDIIFFCRHIYIYRIS